jgi:ectoine hydroxylase-related dioxygenase (phytanoyl-CoA dioxygenase family)
MQPDDSVSHPLKVITEDQRAFYFEHGYLLLENLISPEWIQRLREATDRMVERSRGMTESDAVIDIEKGHSAEAPRLRRVSSPVDHDPVYWEFASQSAIADVAADLAGPDIKYHHSKLNFKWAKGGEEVKWHQDISFWPHTNYSPLTIGTYLDDVGPDQGPIGILPGTHNGPIFDQYGEEGVWAGSLSENTLNGLDLDRVEYLTGPAGSVTIHNCRAIHGSKPNDAAKGRPLLLNAYSSADAYPYTYNPIQSPHYGEVIRGKPARWARHDPRPCQIPPDWSGGYISIYAVQQQEASASM